MQNDMKNVIGNFDKQTNSFPDSVKKLYGLAGEKPSSAGSFGGIDTDTMKSSLKSRAGGDGFVSPQDYKTMEDLYVSHGGTVNDFNSAYGSFKNPSNKNYQ